MTDQPVCNDQDLLENLKKIKIPKTISQSPMHVSDFMLQAGRQTAIESQNRRMSTRMCELHSSVLSRELGEFDTLKTNQNVPADSSWGAKFLARVTPARARNELIVVMSPTQACRRVLHTSF